MAAISPAVSVADQLAELERRILDGEARMSARQLVWPESSPNWRKWRALLDEYEQLVCRDCGSLDIERRTVREE